MFNTVESQYKPSGVTQEFSKSVENIEKRKILAKAIDWEK